LAPLSIRNIELVRVMTTPTQDKQKEIAFFDGHAAAHDYDVFEPQASARIVDAFVKLTELAPGARVIDLGCGSGAFTALLARAGLRRRRPRLQREAARGGPPQAPAHRVRRRRHRASAVPGGKLRRRAAERRGASFPRPLALRRGNLPRAALGRALSRLRSQPDEPLHVALPRPLVAVLQLGRRDRE